MLVLLPMTLETTSIEAVHREAKSKVF